MKTILHGPKITTPFWAGYYEFLDGFLEVLLDKGSATLNRGQAAHSISNSHRGLRPRHLGNSAGATGKANNSSIVQR